MLKTKIISVRNKHQDKIQQMLSSLEEAGFPHSRKGANTKPTGEQFTTRVYLPEKHFDFLNNTSMLTIVARFPQLQNMGQVISSLQILKAQGINGSNVGAMLVDGFLASHEPFGEGAMEKAQEIFQAYTDTCQGVKGWKGSVTRINLISAILYYLLNESYEKRKAV